MLDSKSEVFDYRRMLSNLLDGLKCVRNYAAELELNDVKEHADSVLTRTEDAFFSIGVVGEFKRGKSTLINALLGKEVLPADVLPCSATLNRVTYGLTASAKLVFKSKTGDSSRVEEIPVESLKDYVTKLTPESEIKAADIEEAIIYYPTPYCRDKADIIDTPGLNDDQTMTQVTLSVLNKVDAVIMVILAVSPFAGTEGDFLNNQILMSDIGRVLFVVNRIDEIRKEADRERVLADIKNRIKKSVESRAAMLFGNNKEEFDMFKKRIGEPRVFGVSAIDALDAKISNDNELLEKSGFAKFEKALEHFLTHDRGAVSIQVLADCTVSTAAKILYNIVIKENALTLQQQEFESAYQVTSLKLQDLRTRYEEESLKIDAASSRALSNARQILDQLGIEMKRAAERVINDANITADKLDKQAELLEELNAKVYESLQNVGRLTAEKMQLEIERELASEIHRLQAFATEVQDTMKQIQMHFISIAPSESRINDSEIGDLVIGTAAGALWGIGGLWTGYRQAGIKGALVGFVAGAGLATGTAITGGIIIALLGLPLTWPVMLPVVLASGLASALGGKWAGRWIGDQQQIENFREQYKNSVNAEIDKQLSSRKLEFADNLAKQVADTFIALKCYVKQELWYPVEQTQKTLDDLRSQQTRSKAEQEMELKRLAEMRLETQKVHSRAVAKSNEMREITSV